MVNSFPLVSATIRTLSKTPDTESHGRALLDMNLYPTNRLVLRTWNRMAVMSPIDVKTRVSLTFERCAK